MANYGFQPSVLPASFVPHSITALEEHLRGLRSSWAQVQEALQYANDRYILHADRRHLPDLPNRLGIESGCRLATSDFVFLL